MNLREPNVTPNTSTHDCRTRSKNPKCGSVSGRPKETWRLPQNRSTIWRGDRASQDVCIDGFTEVKTDAVGESRGSAENRGERNGRRLETEVARQGFTNRPTVAATDLGYCELQGWSTSGSEDLDGSAMQIWTTVVSGEARQLQVDGRGGFDPKEKREGGGWVRLRWMETETDERRVTRDDCCKVASRTEMENGREGRGAGRKKKREKRNFHFLFFLFKKIYKINIIKKK